MARPRSDTKYVTKPGKYGTLTRYAIDYTDKDDPGFGKSVWHTWAYDQEHALDRFYESGDDGWKHLDIRRVIDRSGPRGDATRSRRDPQLARGDAERLKALYRKYNARSIGQLRTSLRAQKERSGSTPQLQSDLLFAASIARGMNR